jgi:hypothetical protein
MELDAEDAEALLDPVASKDLERYHQRTPDKVTTSQTVDIQYQ